MRPFFSVTVPCPTVFPVAPPTSRTQTLLHHRRNHKRPQYADEVLRQRNVLGPRFPRLRNFRQVQSALYEISPP